MSEAPGIGDNSVNGGQLRAFVERAEKLNEEKKAVGEDLKELFAEARGVGFDAKILRRLVSIRAQDADKRVEEDAILDLYLTALKN